MIEKITVFLQPWQVCPTCPCNSCPEDACTHYHCEAYTRWKKVRETFDKAEELAAAYLDWQKKD